MAAGTVQSFQCRLSLTTIFPSRCRSLSVSLPLPLPLTKGYSLSHGLRGTLNQTTRSPTNHNAAAGWCNHSHTDLGARTHTLSPWEAYTLQQTHRRTVMHRHSQLFQSFLRALCLGFFSKRGFSWEGCGAVSRIKEGVKKFCLCHVSPKRSDVFKWGSVGLYLFFPASLFLSLLSSLPVA